MLINLGAGVKLPRLAVSTKSKNNTPRAKTVVDDSLEVARKMEQLFSKYNWKTITTEEELSAYLFDKKDLGFDCETTGLFVYKDRLCGISFGTENDCIYIPLAHKVGKNYEGDIKRIEELVASINLWGFNLKFDLKNAKLHAGLNLKGVWCGYLAARLMNCAEPSNELKELYIKYIDPNEQFYSFRELFKKPFDEYDPAVVGAYAAVDAMKHIRLGKYQSTVISSTDRKLLLQLELPLAHYLVDVELRGVKLDKVWSAELVDLLETDLKVIEDKLAKDYNGLNPRSTKQVAEILYDKLKIPMIDGRGTGEGILKLVDHPFASLILEHRGVQKLLSTYARKMPEEADDGIIHATFNQYGADTGRFSSSNPNLQNIPRDNRFRNMFIAREGHTLVSCDYTQQEVYIMAALANDEKMKEAYAKKMDFYAYMASLVFNEPYENCTKKGSKSELRGQMKAIVLALNYDKGMESLTKDLNEDRVKMGKPLLSIDEVRDIYNKFFETCPAVKTFRAAKLEYAKQHGYVETALGRRRYFQYLHKPDFECDNKAVLDVLKTLRTRKAINALIADAKKEGITVVDNRKQKIMETRQVVNSVIQGTAADMTKLAMLEASKDEYLKSLGMQILLQVHDEIIAEFPEENAKAGGDYLSNLMVEVGSELIGITVVCEPALMKRWEKD